MRSAAVVALAVSGLALPGAAEAKGVFAPYMDTTDAHPSLTAIRTGGKVKRVTLGFVTARNASECLGTWGGYPAYPATGATPYMLRSIRAYRRRGGAVIVSFGGQAGTELAQTCPTASALASAYGAVISAYRATRVDFDVEGAAVADTAANARRAQAIAALQRAHRRLRVSYTLPVLPTGLDHDGLATARGAKSGGAKVTVFNLMTMDYGDQAAPKPRGRMAGYAVRAARAARRQLHVPYRRIGVTPMIGINDVATEAFTGKDARKLVRWARRAHLGSLAMWSLGRDRPCPQPSKQARNDCSGVAQKRWAFSRILGRFRG